MSHEKKMQKKDEFFLKKMREKKNGEKDEKHM